MKGSSCLWAALIFIAASGQGFAQSSDDARIQRLEGVVRTLEHRVAALEAQVGERSAAVGVAPDKVGWRKLKSGMTEGQVEQLLGSPSSVDKNEVSITWWYRNPSIGCVVFDTRSRKSRRWSEP